MTCAAAVAPWTATSRVWKVTAGHRRLAFSIDVALGG